MSSLVSLQAALQRHLLEDDEQIANELVSPRQGELAERLAVYADGYRWRLIDALQKEYAPLHHYLGDDAFTELSDAYIDEYPSRFYAIGDFTKQLPQFLLKYQPQQGYLSELAQIINALSFSLEAADAQFLGQAALAKMPIQNWPSLCFKYHPSVHYFSFQWNTFSLWKSLVQKQRFLRLLGKIRIALCGARNYSLMLIVWQNQRRLFLQRSLRVLVLPMYASLFVRAV